jgi:hypothetical protein
MTQGAGANVDGAPEMLRNVQALQRVRGNIVANLFHRHSPEFTIAVGLHSFIFILTALLTRG